MPRKHNPRAWASYPDIYFDWIDAAHSGKEVRIETTMKEASSIKSKYYSLVYLLRRITRSEDEKGFEYAEKVRDLVVKIEYNDTLGGSVHVNPPAIFILELDAAVKATNQRSISI